MYHVRAQGIDERMINVRFLFIFYLTKRSVSAYGHGPVYLGPCLRVYRTVGTLLLGVQ